MIQNSQGKVYYGVHFYPGVAEYHPQGKEPYRVFLNEDTIRSMDPSFAGKPIFVEHVDEVDSNLDELRKEADGWVIESFFNAADGKHWVKFIITSELGLRAVQRGMRLSNAYFPTQEIQGGLWNGVSYAKEIVAGEFQHLAIVSNPRYEESVIMTPDEFKLYNEKNKLELQKISNSKEKGTAMKLNFFKKQKVENAIDPELQVVLPKSGVEVTINQLINEADEKAADKNAGLADMSHKVKMHDGSYMNVGDLLEKHKAMCDELESLKKPKEDSVEEGLELKEKSVDVESSPKKESNDDAMMEDSKKNLMPAEEDKEMKDAKKKNAMEKAEKLRFADQIATFENSAAPVIMLSEDRLARGKALYGSN